MQIINGKEISDRLKGEMAAEVERLRSERGRAPHLSAVLVGNDPASETYVKNKEKSCQEVGISSSVYRLPENTTEAQLREVIDFVNRDEEIDGLIVLQEKMIEKLKDYKQSIITEAVTKGIDPNVELTPSNISWVGTIPSHWSIQRNKNAFICGKEIIGEQSSSTQLLSLTTKGVKTIKLGSTSGKVPESYDTYQIVMPNNLVMCLFDLDCSAVFAGISNYYGMISPAYKVLSCKNAIIPQYANYWFIFVFYGRKFKYYSKNIRYSLTYEEFSAIEIVLPPLSEQVTIASYLDKKCSEIDKLIDVKQLKIEKLKDYKKSVIYEAVTGKINIES